MDGLKSNIMTAMQQWPAGLQRMNCNSNGAGGLKTGMAMGSSQQNGNGWLITSIEMDRDGRGWTGVEGNGLQWTTMDED